jgi:uncharacterized protein YhfF/enamine deaminase RidA (YjgF/YER057c/UK114 family)
MYTVGMTGTIFLNPPGLAESAAYSYGALLPGGARILETGGINGVDREGRVASTGDLAKQTERALQNIDEILESAGAERRHIYRVRILVVDGIELHPGSSAWMRFWHGQAHNPLVTATRVASLVVPDALVEIEVSAAIPFGELNEAATEMWVAFLAGSATGQTAVSRGASPTAWAFGSGREMEDELAELVVTGTKRATATSLRALLAVGEPAPSIGDYSIIYDGSRTPRCIIETTSLHVAPLGAVTDDFAHREGEGDRSREYWLEGHRRFFGAEHEDLGLPFDDSIPVVYEEFSVVWPREFADR